LLMVCLAPRNERLAPLLISMADSPLSSTITASVPALADCTSPRTLCNGLLLLDRLPFWCRKQELQPFGKQLLDVANKQCSALCCQLLAASPLAGDAAVLSALAKATLAFARAQPDGMSSALTQSAGLLGVPAEEGELLAQQVADPLQTEDTLADALRDVAEGWQAEHLRKLLQSS